MRDGNLIFDMVVHVHNMLDENFATRVGRVTQGFKYDHMKIFKQRVETLPPKPQFHQIPPDPQGVVDRVFGPGSQIDYAMAQVVPLFDLFAEDPDVNIARVHAMTQLVDDGRMIFCGGTDPVLRGLNRALRDIEYQVTELGARSIKLYNAHAFGQSWRMDDRSVAYPMFERMLEAGCDLVQIHKGDPQALEPMDALRPGDVMQAALDFPELNFIIHHLAFPYEDEAIDLGSRLPNVYLAMSTWINMIHVAPIETAMRLGKMLSWCSPEKVLWGSEAPIWPSAQHLLDLSWEFQIPKDLRDGWGFPEITDEDRAKMFGGNMLRLLKMEDSATARVTAPVEGAA
jgi:uncharacterized protein